MKDEVYILMWSLLDVTRGGYERCILYSFKCYLIKQSCMYTFLFVGPNKGENKNTIIMSSSFSFLFLRDYLRLLLLLLLLICIKCHVMH